MSLARVRLPEASLDSRYWCLTTATCNNDVIVRGFDAHIVVALPHPLGAITEVVKNDSCMISTSAHTLPTLLGLTFNRSRIALLTNCNIAYLIMEDSPHPVLVKRRYERYNMGFFTETYKSCAHRTFMATVGLLHGTSIISPSTQMRYDNAWDHYPESTRIRMSDDHSCRNECI